MAIDFQNQGALHLRLWRFLVWLAQAAFSQTLGPDSKCHGR